MNALRGSHINHVYGILFQSFRFLSVDMTISYYPTNMIPPTLLQIFSLPQISPLYRFHVHVKRYDMSDVRSFVNKL